MELFVILVLVITAGALVRFWQSERRGTKNSVAPLGLPAQVALRYTKHARERMRERHVSEAEIEMALRSPDRIDEDEANFSVKFEKDFPGRTLKVWVARELEDRWRPTRESIVKSTAWRYTVAIPIAEAKIGRLIGKKGATISAIRAASGASVRIDQGHVRISAGERRGFERAKQMVLDVLNETSRTDRRS